MKAWRCELTALSQRHNLYFVACNDFISVHEPGFPDQWIPAEPRLVFYPPPLRLYQPVPFIYGIDPNDPHSITRILVDYLGNDEILLVACDDGDVIGFRIEEIWYALQSRCNDTDPKAIKENIKPFFHRNIGASAWGIAVHRKARMIAFSANSFKITVIAFALAYLNEETSSSDESEWSKIPPEPEFDGGIADSPSQRIHDRVFTVAAYTNIPSIAFDNTGKDPKGRWLLSSSIDGKTILFDLHHKQLCMVLQMGWCASVTHPGRAPLSEKWLCNCKSKHNVLHAAWGAMFLDVLSAHETCIPRIDLKHKHEAPYFKEADRQKRRFSVVKNNPSDNVAPPGTESSPSTTNELGDDSESLEASSSDDALTEHAAESNEDSLDADSNEEDESDENSQGHTSTNRFLMQANIRRRQLPYFDFQIRHRLKGEPEDVSDCCHSINPEQHHLPHTALDDHHIHFADAVQFHLPRLIITKDDIFLIQRPPPSETASRQTDSSLYPYLVTTMRFPLHPGNQDPIPSESYDRHCFSAQIPELGIFIIASPLGRAAIFSLTKSREPPDAEHCIYGFQLEHILPFVKGAEEKVCDIVAPKHRLAGIAVGPVQGMLDKRADTPSGDDGYDPRAYGEGKWRLLIYYTDHTVLSYEIARKKTDGDLWLGDIVV